jgi:hypothetical protein
LSGGVCRGLEQLVEHIWVVGDDRINPSLDEILHILSLVSIPHIQTIPSPAQALDIIAVHLRVFRVESVSVAWPG